MEKAKARRETAPKAVVYPDPNLFAYVMLLIWPVVVWQFYRHFGPVRGLIWSILGAYMLLPEQTRFDLPVMPELNKNTLPAVAVVVTLWLQFGRRLKLMPQNRLAQILIAMFVISPFVTVLGNSDGFYVGGGITLPGMRIYDSFAVVLAQGMLILPFWLARQELASVEAMHELLRALCIAGLLYALPMLLESLLSPQLHIWVYGFFQHDFSQALRFGGYRPFVFMPHGLWVAFFAVMCLGAASFFLRQGPAELRPKQTLLFLVCVGLVILSKSFGPALYAMLVILVLLCLSPRRILLLAGGMAFVVVLYPLLRGSHLVPVDRILEFAAGLSAERGDSLAFRLMNEEQLLARAAERPLFGWGGYGRNFLHDPATGEMSNIADGAWIIAIGSWGWLGFLAQFGLLTLPLLLCAREARDRAAQIAPEAAAIAFVLALNLIDLLPNATLVPLTWLMAGTLLGYAEALRGERLQREAVDQQLLRGAGSRTVI